MQPQEDHPHVPGPSLWPVGFAVGVVVLMIGLIVSWWIAGVGAVIALAFAFLWIRDLTAGTELVHTPEVPPESPTGPAIPASEGPDAMPVSLTEERYPRSKFLEISTIGLGAVIGGFLVGVFENLAGTYIPGVGNELKLPIALALIITVLVVKPAGLFGRPIVKRV